MRYRGTVALALAVACRSPQSAPVARAWPAMATMMSAAVWGPDSGRLERALDAARDTVDRIAGLVEAKKRFAAFDSLRHEVRQRTGVTLADSGFVAGYALDRAALTMAGIADSALFDLGGQFLWFASGATPTRRIVGIPDPDNSLLPIGTVEMRTGSVRTTSRTNPRRGEARSVTALAPTALAAHAWSAALFELGCDRALALAPSLERLGVGGVGGVGGVSVVCSDSSGLRWTPDLEERVWVPTPTAAAAPPARAP